MDAQGYYLSALSLSTISYFSLCVSSLANLSLLIPLIFKNGPVSAVLCPYRVGTYVHGVVALFDSALRRSLI